MTNDIGADDDNKHVFSVPSEKFECRHLPSLPHFFLSRLEQSRFVSVDWWRIPTSCKRQRSRKIFLGSSCTHVACRISHSISLNIPPSRDIYIYTWEGVHEARFLILSSSDSILVLVLLEWIRNQILDKLRVGTGARERGKGRRGVGGLGWVSLQAS